MSSSSRGNTSIVALALNHSWTACHDDDTAGGRVPGLKITLVLFGWLEAFKGLLEIVVAAGLSWLLGGVYLLIQR